MRPGVRFGVHVRAAWLIFAMSSLAACGDDGHDASQDDDDRDSGTSGNSGGSGGTAGGDEPEGGSGGSGMSGRPDGSTPEPDAGQTQDAGSEPDANTAPDSGGTGVCENLDDPCDVAGTSCDDDTLVTCAENSDGCLVETRTDCTDGDTEFCDSEATPPACADDPCADLTDACETAGTSCEGLNLITCAANGDGCLVETTTDCTDDASNNYCLTGATPACAYDPCRDAEGTPKESVCVVDETMCAEDVLIRCVDDLEGCPIATPTDCTTAPGMNYCNAAAEPPACGFDPCIGVTDCLVAGVTCRDTDVVTCAANIDLCLVETVTDCTQEGTVNQTCDATGGTPQCVTCVPDPACVGLTEGDTSCDENALLTCTDTDDDTCLDLVTENCGGDFTCDDVAGCEYSGGATCDSAIELVLRAPGSFGSFDTTSAGSQYNGYTCPGLIIPFVAQGPDLLFALDVPAGQVTTVNMVDADGFTGIGAYMMLLTSCEDDAAAAESTCEAVSATSVTYANEGDTTVRVYISVDADGAGNNGTFGLEVDTHALGCGDGLLDGSEQCDDGNIFASDGCTAACMLETGYACTAASPSVCTRRPTDSICGNVMCDPLPAGAPGGSLVCCTPTQQCGVTYPLLYGAGCMARDQEGVDDDACPDEPSVFFFSTLAGCCRPDDRCGVRTTTGGGCVERTQIWSNMQDGFGEFLYSGPFEEIACSFD